MGRRRSSKREHLILNTRRLGLTVALALVAVACVDKLVTLVGGRLLDLWYPFGAARLLTFANTFLLLAIALYEWEIRHERARPELARGGRVEAGAAARNGRRASIASPRFLG
jgi:hypothetical protein